MLVILVAAGCAHRTAVEHEAETPSDKAETPATDKLHELIVKRVVMSYMGAGEMTPVVILTNKENGKQSLLIWVGLSEGRSIDMALNKSPAERPGTHDLFSSVLGQFQMKLVRVVVTDLRESTYFAVITMESNGEVKEIDARPSDAIALALRSEAPIFVSDEVIRKSGWTRTRQRGRRRRNRKQSEDEESDNLL